MANVVDYKFYGEELPLVEIELEIGGVFLGNILSGA